MTSPLIRFLAREMVDSAMLRFLAAAVVGLVGFCLGLVTSWGHPAILIVLAAPQSFALSLAVAVLPALVLAAVPFRRVPPTKNRVLLPAGLLAAAFTCGLAGHFFGVALRGI